MFNKRKKEEEMPLKLNLLREELLSNKINYINNYKRNLNEWFVLKKVRIFNLETIEEEYFLEIAPMERSATFFLKDFVTKYKIDEELYNKIQENDIIKLIVDKEEK